MQFPYIKYFKRIHKEFKNNGLNTTFCLLLLLAKFEFYSRYFPYHLYPTLESIQLEPTTRCNLRCEMCIQNSQAMKRGDMEFKDFKKIIEMFPKLKMIRLSGFGEPFLHKDIFRMIKFLKERNVHVTTTTNATLLDKDMCRKIISSGLDSLGFSLDGATANTYEETRKGAKFDKVIENIKTLTNMIEDSNFERPSTTICSVGMVKKIHELPLMVRLTHDLGIKKLFYRDVQVKYNVGINKDQSFYFSTYGDERKTKRVEEYFDEAQSLANRLGVQLLLPRLKKTNQENKCTSPWRTTYITWEGNVTPCCTISTDFICGNLHECHLNEIWRNSNYTKFREELKKSDPLPGQCINCLWNS